MGGQVRISHHCFGTNDGNQTSIRIFSENSGNRTLCCPLRVRFYLKWVGFIANSVRRREAREAFAEVEVLKEKFLHSKDQTIWLQEKLQEYWVIEIFSGLMGVHFHHTIFLMSTSLSSPGVPFRGRCTSSANDDLPHQDRLPSTRLAWWWIAAPQGENGKKYFLFSVHLTSPVHRRQLIGIRPDPCGGNLSLCWTSVTFVLGSDHAVRVRGAAPAPFYKNTAPRLEMTF